MYNLTLGKLYKWLVLAIKTRKDDIIRRKAMIKKCREDRDNQISQAELRDQKRVTELAEAEEKFKDEHKDDIEAAIKAEQEE